MDGSCIKLTKYKRHIKKAVHWCFFLHELCVSGAGVLSVRGGGGRTPPPSPRAKSDMVACVCIVIQWGEEGGGGVREGGRGRGRG